MSYKANKNLTTSVFALLLILGNTHMTHAQGVVSVVDDNAGFEDDAFPDVDLSSDSAVTPAEELNTDLPTTLSEADVIPLDNGLISPEDSKVPSEEAPAENKATVFDEEFEPAPDASFMPEMAPAAEGEKAQPEDVQAPSAKPDEAEAPAEEFSLGLEAVEPEKAEEKTPESTVALAPNKPEQVANVTNPLVAQVAEPVAPAEKFANSVLAKVDNDLFGQMSDIEKQTTLLTLELRREKIRSEIEAVKAQREKAEREKLAAEEEKKRKEEEWKKEQEIKVLKEQQALQDKMIELEKLQQRKMLNAYMNQMLEQNQKWIEKNAKLHEQIREAEEERKKLVTNFKAKIAEVQKTSSEVLQNATNAKNNHDRTVASLTAQNIQLKKRIEADALAAKNREANPFGDMAGAAAGVRTSVDGKIDQVVLAKEYAIMEITGKGDNLAARLINKNGETFVVRKGTTLHTGHMVTTITENYVEFDKDGLQDYLYTAGSSLGGEPQKMDSVEETSNATPKPSKKAVVIQPQARTANVDQGVPSLGTGMFVK